MSAFLSRLKQVAAKVESAEGTAESLSNADAKLLVYDPKVSFDIEMFQRNPARESLSKLSKIPGKRPGGLTFGLMLRGSGTATTSPEWFRLIRACGFEDNAFHEIAIGAVTSGPFVHGETITGGTSSATGRVIIETANGASTIFFKSLSGTFQSGEVITGGTSGATATTGGTPSAKGRELKPISLNDDIPTLTMAGYENGVRKLLKGCRGKFKVGFQTGSPARADFEFMGVEAGVADVAMLSGISHETTKPPAFLNTTFSVDDVAHKISKFDIDYQTELSPREDPAESRGIISFLLTGKDPVGTMDPEMVLAATHDFHTKWFGGTEMVLDAIIGSTAGNRLRFYGPKVQYSKVDDGDRGGIQTAECTFDLNGSESPGNDELTILHY